MPFSTSQPCASPSGSLGPQHVRGDEIVIRQHKTGDEVKQPVHPEMMWLSGRLGPTTALAFLTTRYGVPYTPKGLANAFKIGA